jgi:hypothetical protein
MSTFTAFSYCLASILIDDRLSLKEAWEERGGIFIHHTEIDRTLSILREKGILSNKSD